MGLRSKIGWGIAAILAVALIYRDDDRSSSAATPPATQRTSEPSRPVTQWPAEPTQPKASPERAIRRPAVEVAVVEPDEPPPIVRERQMFTTARVRLRAEPNTKSAALRTLEKGTRLISVAENGGWLRVRYDNKDGWIRGDYLTDRQPEVVMAPDPPPAAIISKPRQKTAEPVRAARTGEPVRGPMRGRCDCPYDEMRNGRSCGGRSAWSKPGGRQPVCYVGD